MTRMGKGWTTLILLSVTACGASSDTEPGSPPASSAAPSARAAYFPPGATWYRDVSREALDPQSAAVIANLDRAGWGLGRMQIDFSIEVHEAAADTPLLAFTPTADHFRPDCDLDPVPVPAGGALEGESGYECRGDGDCHLIVADRSRQRLYEMWRANLVGGLFRGGCLAVWDMGRVYPPTGRGEQCTSADAAGYPIAPLLFSADEVAAGRLDHAIRLPIRSASGRGRKVGEEAHSARLIFDRGEGALAAGSIHSIP